MKVLILAPDEYVDFVTEAILPYINTHDFEIGVSDVEGLCDKYVAWDEADYDVGLSFMYRYRVPKEEVEKAPWINFHPAPLPEYKGRNLCYHAIMNGEKEFGATVHYMDESFDTGDIIEVRRFPILDWWTSEDLSTFTIMQSKIQFKKFLPRILAEEDFLRYPNPKGTYYKKANIAEVVSLDKDAPLSRFIRAVYYPPYYPKLEIGGVTYKIVKDE